ncbi:MAG: ACP S-malonyltransferase [Proteobacteria bacterium]|nr:ACP S-malonyltransferase [Pseudomonadota bacterium]
MMQALLFPGQGSQSIGMGKELSVSYDAAKKVFDEVDEALGEKLSDLIWNGDLDELTLTKNAQPALMAMSLAVIAALKSEGFSLESSSYFAGHSLGEYSALAAAGSISIWDSARLLRLRGLAMQSAVPVGAGAMAAILGLEYNDVVDVSEDARRNDVCEVANDNDPSQVVVSGHKAAVERAIEIAKKKGAKRAVLLPVSAPFHCKLMAPASDIMVTALSEIKILPPAVPIVTNVTARPTIDPNEIKGLLVEQVTGTVKWRESIFFMAKNGVTKTLEIGAGKALSGMVRRIDRSISTKSIGGAPDVAGLIAELNN